MATSWTRVDLVGASSVSARGTVGNTVAELVKCYEPAARVIIQNQDATATNTITWLINGTPVSGTDGIILDGANAKQEVFLVKGDVLSAIAGSDRAVDIVVTPYY